VSKKTFLALKMNTTFPRTTGYEYPERSSHNLEQNSHFRFGSMMFQYSSQTGKDRLISGVVQFAIHGSNAARLKSRAKSI